MTERFLICTGEASGDEHAAGVCAELRRARPGCHLRGMAGPASAAAGMSLDIDYRQAGGGVMGITRVLASFREIRSSLGTMKRLLGEWKPQALLLIDFPDFNFRLAKAARDLNIPVIYFIPPKIWAWRKHRYKFLKRYCKSIALIFPFEQTVYRQLGVDCAEFVGHPFPQTLHKLPQLQRSPSETRQALGLRDVQTIGFFPGSRWGEVEAHLPIVLNTWTIIREQFPNSQGIIGFPDSIPAGKVEEKFRLKQHGLHVVFGRSLEVMRASDAALIKSGTSNLQAAFLGLPFVMFYKAPLLFEVIGRILVRLTEFSPVNIVRAHTVVELIQRQATPQNCAAELQKILENSPVKEQVRSGLREVVAALSPPSAQIQNPYSRVAELIISSANTET